MEEGHRLAFLPLHSHSLPVQQEGAQCPWMLGTIPPLVPGCFIAPLSPPPLSLSLHPFQVIHHHWGINKYRNSSFIPYCLVILAYGVVVPSSPEKWYFLGGGGRGYAGLFKCEGLLGLDMKFWPKLSLDLFFFLSLWLFTSQIGSWFPSVCSLCCMAEIFSCADRNLFLVRKAKLMQFSNLRKQKYLLFKLNDSVVLESRDLFVPFTH